MHTSSSVLSLKNFRSPQWLRWMLTVLCCAAGSRHPAWADAPHPSRPNVLFLAVDDMKDWVHCLGGYEGVVHTPNIDRLARRGMLFSNTHCASPKCAPSRAALLTGLRPSTSGLYDNGHWWMPNLPDVVTLPAWFRRQGYHVAGAGKIFHHTAGNHPPNQWNHFQRITFQEDPWFRGVRLNYPWSRPEPYPNGFPFSGVAGLGHENDWGSLPIEDDQYDDQRSVDYVVEFLRQPAEARDARPFFLACGLFRPHLPWYVPQRYFDRYPLDQIVLPKAPDDDLDDIPAAGLNFARARRSDWERIRDAGKWKAAVQAYLANITCTDDRLGQVLDALDRSPHSANTIVVLWSDHGWHLGEKQHWHKTTLWEEATRVPLIIRVPGLLPGVCRRPVSLIDIYPTLKAVLEERLPTASGAANATQKLDGVSLLPLLRQPDRAWSRPAVIEFKRGNAAVRTQTHRYIRYQDGGEELYDHTTDPHEWRNLAKDQEQRAVIRQLEKWLPRAWAAPAETKSAFRFDYQSFTWTHKKTGAKTSGMAGGK